MKDGSGLVKRFDNPDQSSRKRKPSMALFLSYDSVLYSFTTRFFSKTMTQHYASWLFHDALHKYPFRFTEPGLPTFPHPLFPRQILAAVQTPETLLLSHTHPPPTRPLPRLPYNIKTNHVLQLFILSPTLPRCRKPSRSHILQVQEENPKYSHLPASAAATALLIPAGPRKSEPEEHIHRSSEIHNLGPENGILRRRFLLL